MERRKLFSSTTPTQRRKLFSDPVVEDVVNQNGDVLKSYRCQDCGYVLESCDTTTSMVCPKCGGKRFNVEHAEEKTYCEKQRRKLFSADVDEEREFSEGNSEFEEKLKTFSGKTLSTPEFEKEFSALGITAEDLEARNFAEISEESVSISPNAYIQSRLFSKITISITKEFDLNPEIMSGCDKKEVIGNLENHADLGPKGFILIKKAHGIVPLEHEHDSWISDSGISHDLPAEFGGENKNLEDFKRTLDERYPDAPENILDLLKKHGVIDMHGDLVEIKK